MEPNSNKHGLQITLLRMRDLPRITGCAKATLYKKIAAGQFPPGVPLSDKAGSSVGWPSNLVDQWVQERIDRAASKAGK